MKTNWALGIDASVLSGRQRAPTNGLRQERSNALGFPVSQLADALTVLPNWLSRWVTAHLMAHWA